MASILYADWGADTDNWSTYTVSTTLATTSDTVYWSDPTLPKKKHKKKPETPKVDGPLEWLDRRINEIRVPL